jgi:hypothetical protein
VGNCSFRNNTAGLAGALGSSFSSITVVDSVFSNNVATELGVGALSMSFNDESTLRNCVFAGNKAILAGGVLLDRSNASIDNCTFIGNEADLVGGAMLIYGSDPVLLNSVFFANTVNTMGAGIYYMEGGNPTLTNCTLWNNRDQAGVSESAQIDGDNDGVPQIDYSCIQGLTGNLGGIGNIGDDPLFVDPVGPDGISGTLDDNLRLLPESPCVDTGDPVFIQPGATDADGLKRVWNARIDMGPFEFGSFPYGDLNCDAAVDAFDIEAFILALFAPEAYEASYPFCDRTLADLDGDGRVTTLDIEPFLALLFP